MTLYAWSRLPAIAESENDASVDGWGALGANHGQYPYSQVFQAQSGRFGRNRDLLLHITCGRCPPFVRQPLEARLVRGYLFPQRLTCDLDRPPTQS